MMRFDARSLKSFYGLSLAVRRRGGIRLLRRPRVLLAAGAGEPTGLRDYSPGDDYRHIDWGIYARRGEILSKVFEGTEDRPLYVLVDCSSSMALGSPAKLDVARHIAALLGYVSIVDEERVGAMAFSGRIVAELPPVYGKASVRRWLQFVEQIKADDMPTDLACVADRLVRRCGRSGPAIVVSDLFDSAGFEPGLDLLRRGGYDPRVVHLYDPLEGEPDLLGDVELVDAERGEGWNVTVTERALREYRALFARFLDSVRNFCSRRGTVCVQLSTAQTPNDWHRQLLGLPMRENGGRS
jgi:uncharacterized protein (DUF58 family)